MEETLRVRITAEVAKFKSGVSDAIKELGDLEVKGTKVGDKLKSAFAKAGENIKSALSKAGTGAAALSGALIASNAATEEYRQSMAQLTTSYEELGLGAEAAQSTVNGFYRIIGDMDTATEASALLGQLTQDQQSLEEWTTICAGAMAKFPDSLPTESLIEACNETKNTGQVTGALADALNWAGASEEEFQKKLDACNSVAEQEALIRETLTDLYGDAGEKYLETTDAIGDQREAQLKLTDTIAKLGEAMAPVMTAFITFATEALQPIIDKMAPLAERYAPQFQEAMEAAGEAVGNAFGFFVDHWEIFAALAGIIAGVAAAIGIYNTVIGIQAGLETARAAAVAISNTALWGHVAAMAAAMAPYLPIIAVIGALIAVIVLCVTHWEEISETVKKVAKSIKEEVSKMAEKVGQLFDFIKETISEKVEAAKQAVTTAFENIKKSISDKVTAAKEKVSSTFEGIKSDMKSKMDSAKSTVLGIFDSIKSGVEERINKAKDAVNKAIEKIKSLMKFDWTFPKPKLPSFYLKTGSRTILGQTITFPTGFGINWNAKGAIFSKPTIFDTAQGLQGVGEAGPEAVAPIDTLLGYVKQAVREEMSGNNGTVALYIDSTKLGEVAVKGINQYTGLAGSCQLRYV